MIEENVVPDLEDNNILVKKDLMFLLISSPQLYLEDVRDFEGSRRKFLCRTNALCLNNLLCPALEKYKKASFK